MIDEIFDVEKLIIEVANDNGQVQIYEDDPALLLRHMEHIILVLNKLSRTDFNNSEFSTLKIAVTKLLIEYERIENERCD